MATKQLGDPSASLLLTSEKAISCKIQFQHIPRFICLYWIYSSGYILPTIIRWVFFLYIWLLGPNFAGAQFAGARTRGPYQGPDAGAQFATKNYQGPNLPQKITRGPFCRCPICLEPILRSIMLNCFFGFSNIAAIFVQGMEREEKNILGLPSGYCWILIIRVVESSCDPDSSRKRFPPSKPLALRVTRLTRSLCRSNRYY